MNLRTARTRFALALTVLAAPALMFASSSASAADLTAAQIMSQFNAVVTNDFSTNSDVEGRLVAGTINNPGSSTFYEKPNPQSAPSTFKGVNALTIQSCPSCNVNNGGGVDYVTSNSGSFNLNGGGSVAQNSPSFAMSDFTTPLNGLVSQLSGMTANSTVNISSNSLQFNVAPVKGVAVFTLTAAQLAGQNAAISFLNETSANEIIINVTGGGVFTEGGGENFNSDTYLDEHVIWNFENASNLNFKTWGGAILGEDATVTNSSPLNGFLYAANFTGGGELHSFPLEGGVPEPGTWAMMIVGIAGIGLMSRRRRNQATATA